MAAAIKTFHRPESTICIKKQASGCFLLTAHEGWELPGNEGWAKLTAAQARALGHMLLGEVDAYEMIQDKPARICKQDWQAMLELDDDAEPPDWVHYTAPRKPKSAR